MKLDLSYSFQEGILELLDSVLEDRFDLYNLLSIFNIHTRVI
jgi:hypothetical protein